jgi:ParB family chromosome partitioning protein
MSAKKKRLGRGLDALLASTDPTAVSGVQDELRNVPIDLLKRGRYQPRTRMDEAALQELAQSIRSRGIVQPVLARATVDGGYEIIAGERRWRAAQLAGLQTVPVVVREVPDEAAMAISLIENIQRENLNPIEEAMGLRRLLDEFGLTHEQVAESIGRSRSAVTNLLRLLGLNSKVRRLLEEKKLEMGHARALLALSGRAQDTAAAEVASKGLSVRQTEALVKRRPGTRGKSTIRLDPDVRRLQEKLSDKLGTQVTISDRGGKGKLTIEYHSLDELQGILKRIR